jgi:predicted transcriptional regulator
MRYSILNLTLYDHGKGGEKMRSKTRTNDMIKSRILKACANGARKNRITNQASTNSIKLISYLLLIDEGLIEVVDDGAGIIHRTTPKGWGLVVGTERFRGDIDKLACLT